MPERVTAWVGLGSNLGDAIANVLAAADLLAAQAALREVTLSPLYRTRPWGVVDQPDFVNAVVRLRTALAPSEMLELLLDLERDLGRERTGARRWGPRRIDLDLLMLGDTVCESPGLVLPHPHLHERAFVLAPMLDLEPDVVIPGRGPARDCLSELGRAEVTRIDDEGPDAAARGHQTRSD